MRQAVHRRPPTAQDAQQRLRSLGRPEVAAVSAVSSRPGRGSTARATCSSGSECRLFARWPGSSARWPCPKSLTCCDPPSTKSVCWRWWSWFRSSRRAISIRGELIYDLYLGHTRFVNNWDLVDLSSPSIVGGYLADRSRQPLVRLAKSASLWERRIAILATFHFIRQGAFADTLKIATLLLQDKEDLIHKAVGWMLREVGKRDVASEEGFLKLHHREMPRTMLRYAIERLPKEQRLAWLGSRNRAREADSG